MPDGTYKAKPGLKAAARIFDFNLVAPALWSDNYIELMPGEPRTLTAIPPKNAWAGTAIVLSGWNTAARTPHPPAGDHGPTTAAGPDGR